VSDIMSKLQPMQLENLERAVSTLDDWANRGMTDEEIARRLESYANMLSLFTGNPVYVNDSIVPRRKFGRNWRQLLDTAVLMLARTRGWFDRGFNQIEFEYGNRSCRPVTEHLKLRYSRGRFASDLRWIGDWNVLDRMVSVYHHNGVIEEPTAEQTEVSKA
jgi:hypothetical protein